MARGEGRQVIILGSFCEEEMHSGEKTTKCNQFDFASSGKCSEETHELAHHRGEGGQCSFESVSVERNLAKLLSSQI